MKYKIKVFYYDGDSFKTEDKEDYLDGSWENEDVIRENLNRIKEHYRWYKWETSYKWDKNPPSRPIWHTKEMPEFSIKLLMDNGTERVYQTFWCGYFEGLYGAKAELQFPDGFEISA